MRVLTTLRGQRTKKMQIIVGSKCSAREGFHALERHSGVNGDETSDRSHGERDAAGQGLTRARAALYRLLERGVRREANGRISTLPHHLTRFLIFLVFRHGGVIIIKTGSGETYYGE